MRSLIILEVEHGEDTDALQAYAKYLSSHTFADTDGAVLVNDYTVRVDLPECFRLDA